MPRRKLPTGGHRPKEHLDIARDIPEEKYGFRAAPESRTVKEMLIHLALSTGVDHQIHGMEGLATLKGFDCPAEGDRWVDLVEGLSGVILAQPVTMLAEMKPSNRSRFEMLLRAKEHELHHRGRLRGMQRLLGIVPHLTRSTQARRSETNRTGAAAKS